MKLKIDGVEYELKPISPALAPFSDLYSIKAKEHPRTLEEAEEIAKTIEGAVAKLLEGCVSPKPKKEYETQVLKALFDLTNKVLEDAGLFRQGRKPDTKKSNTTRPGDSQAPKRDSEA